MHATLARSVQVLRQAVAPRTPAGATAHGTNFVCAAAAEKRRQKAAPSGGGAGGSRPSRGGSGAKAGDGAALFTAAAPAAAGPLGQRTVLADKLTQTAKNIEWMDLPEDRPVEATREQIDALQQRLGYQFRNRYLLRLALIHSSAAATHNSIMAWLGDAALYVVVAEEAAAALGNIPIGKLTEVRKALIGRAMCERYANHLGLGQYLVLGKSVRVERQSQPSTNMLAEMFEAVMGAIYLDGDLDAVRAVYTRHFPLPADPLSLLSPDGVGGGSAASAAAASKMSAWD